MTRELLSEVFGEEVDYVDESIIHKKEGHFLAIRFKNGDYHDMPLCYIAHKCKEWACGKGYHLITLVYDNDAKRLPTNGICTVKYSCDMESTYIEVYRCDAPTEPESIFKACEWILKDKR